ncbi:ABC transporter ATP-binding protein [Sphingomonas sp.]|jgi:iron complex transport system ATP-binding protein|uniref:ABC transporter ATP-binding protein n=1 Tax=Sphingomonas sp. TaxID=28214 RepID=UPI002D7E7ABF|nr:ABC transporter ATP-binding protein [Sphingomonas sp.]HEU0044026.1 ABC transporter ATP-binding protein [Sphingomonas sp.]
MALSLDDVTVRVGGATLLDRVTATVAPGRVTAILGPNGAGKSTLLRAAAALIRADGRVCVDGEDIIRMSSRSRARAIGYLPQDAAVHWNLRVHEVVALGRLPHAALPMEDRAATDRALAVTATSAFADRPIVTLSGGERARVLLARVLAGEPRYLLADEPLAALDPAHQIDLVARLRAYAAGGAGVAVVVHDLLQAQVAADDAVLLDGGRVVAAGPSGDVLTPDNLARVFGIRVAAVENQGRKLWVPVGR